MTNLTALPNIGNTLAEKLLHADITSPEELERLGSVAATLRIGSSGGEPCYNMLYALEGAIQRVRWHALPAELRRGLKEEYDRLRGGM